MTDAPSDTESDGEVADAADGSSGSDGGSSCSEDPVAMTICTSQGLKFLWICEAGPPPDAGMCKLVSTMDWWCCP